MLKYTLQVDIKHEDLSALSEGLFSVIRDNGLDFRGAYEQVSDSEQV